MQASRRFPSDIGRVVKEDDVCLKINSEQWDTISKPEMRIPLFPMLSNEPSGKFQ